MLNPSAQRLCFVVTFTNDILLMAACLYTKPISINNKNRDRQRDCVNCAQEVYLNGNDWEIKPLLLTELKQLNYCNEEETTNEL